MIILRGTGNLQRDHAVSSKPVWYGSGPAAGGSCGELVGAGESWPPPRPVELESALGLTRFPGDLKGHWSLRGADPRDSRAGVKDLAGFVITHTHKAHWCRQTDETILIHLITANYQSLQGNSINGNILKTTSRGK